MKSILNLLILALVALVSLAGYAAKPNAYYKVDEKLARTIAAEKTASITDADTRAVREYTVIEAFNELFRISRVKERDVVKILTAIAKRDDLADSLARMRVEISIKETIMADTAAVASENPEVTQARNDIEQLRSRIEEARAELDLALASMRADSLELVAAREQADSMRLQLDGLQAENDRINAEIKK
ncbi:MAG: hypothetical protein K2L14_06435 [Duncaniella sp.]|nr:hypothetical protein [Duncaniella sp.]